MHSTIRILLGVVLAGGISAPSFGAAAPIDVRVEIPSNMMDAAPLRAHVIVTNRSVAAVDATVPAQNVTLFPRVLPLEDFGTGKCHARVSRSRVSVAGQPVRIAPGGRLTAEVDLLDGFPLGFPPGRYRLFVDYRSGGQTTTSAPADFEIRAPAGEEYRAFLDVCHHLRGGVDGSAQALRFVRAHPRFFFDDALLEYARINAQGERRMEVNGTIIERNTSVEAVARADADNRALAERSKELAAYAAYLETFAAQLRDPANAETAREFRQLGTILDQAGFDRHEQFLRKYPRSFFSAEAIHGIIAAISQGVLPKGVTAADTDRVLAQYYRLLLRSDVRSYWVAQAQRDPSVAQLLMRNARE